jgi:uncharacterized membrane protein YtjA (UPF0391 family)
MFLVIAIIAGVFGFSGIAGTASQIAWILFVVGLILALLFLLMARRPPIWRSVIARHKQAPTRPAVRTEFAESKSHGTISSRLNSSWGCRPS